MTAIQRKSGRSILGRLLADELVEEPLKTKRRLFLAAAFFFVAAVRIALFVWAQESAAFTTDFDLLYHSAITLVDGTNPYRSTPIHLKYPLFYPLPAVLVALPFTALPIELARPAFDIAVGWIFAYALWRQAPYALLALLSGAYLFAMRAGQTTPMVVAASLIPALGLLLTVKPNTGLACLIARPSRQAILGGLAVLVLTVIVLPSWPLDWWTSIQHQSQHIRPPVLQPFGWLLLLAAFRWRTSGGRLLLALAIIPQNTLPHELVPLVLIPGNTVEMAVYVIGSWVAVALTSVAMEQATSLSRLVSDVWVVLLLSVYLPALFMVLRNRR